MSTGELNKISRIVNKTNIARSLLSQSFVQYLYLADNLKYYNFPFNLAKCPFNIKYYHSHDKWPK